MPPGRDYAQILDRLFQRSPVARLDQLRRALKTTARTTVFRALSTVGYRTSDSHAGRYYTLTRIPEFDAWGLWVVRDVRFSVHGTLRATVERRVKQAPAGYTHAELQAILGLRVHDPLRSLVAAGRIARARVSARYVYVDVVPAEAAAQLARKRAGPGGPAAAGAAPLDLARVVDVLVAVIRDPRATAPQIAAPLRARGLARTDAHVADGFARYALGKTTARSRSRRWAR